jgi:hypothetical protein
VGGLGEEAGKGGNKQCVGSRKAGTCLVGTGGGGWGLLEVAPHPGMVSPFHRPSFCWDLGSEDTATQHGVAGEQVGLVSAVTDLRLQEMEVTL